MATREPARPTFRRSSGLLLHVTSLPGRFGIGDLGPAAHRWIDQLASAGQTWWQVLPLTPPILDSPYTSLSAMAGNPMLISPEALLRDGLLNRDDLPAPMPGGCVDYPRAIASRERLLDLAMAHYRAGGGRRLRNDFERFCALERGWLNNFALFMALRQAHGGRNWVRWPRGLARRQRDALREARQTLAETIERHAFAQFLFGRQLDALRAHARQRGVALIGDVPIFVAHDSADVWSRPELFQLDRNLLPRTVAGVPPDYFSATGQRWGNPLYDWRAMQREGFDWWVQRFRSALRQTDVVRIDHFRGFEAYWSIPAGARTARRGKWVKAPGHELFTALREALGGLPFIAEDLGVITPAVEKLRDAFALPGMRVLQFAFGSGADNPFLPHNYVRNTVAYTGTHDNDTTAGWYATLDRAAKRQVRQYLPEINESSVGWAAMRAVWGSVADLAIAPVQDLLGLGNNCRMNLPGTSVRNWQWRLQEGQIHARHLLRLRSLTSLYNRLP